jgi:signal transduction histidine kinase
MSRLEKCFDKIALQQRAERAEAQSEAKSRVPCHHSHELRTPLNAIIGFAGLMEDQRFGHGAPRYREYVTISKTAVNIFSDSSTTFSTCRGQKPETHLQEVLSTSPKWPKSASRECRRGPRKSHLRLELALPAFTLMLRGDRSSCDRFSSI